MLSGSAKLADENPFVGFSDNSPVFVEVAEGRYRTNPAKLKYFNDQNFVMPKPDNVFRIIAFGGSTTYGRPYLMNTAFPEWLKQLLERYAPGKKYEVINAGGISYASYRVRRLMNEMIGYQPDLFIVYSGHNEFLEERTFAKVKNQSNLVRSIREVAHQSRIYSLLTRSLQRFNSDPSKTVLGEDVAATLEAVGGPELYHRNLTFRDGVVSQFRLSIESMVDLATTQQIPIVLSTLPVNLSGLSPFKSEPNNTITPEQLQAWNEYFQQGSSFILDGNYTSALQAYQSAGQIDDGSALLAFRIGQLLEINGQYSAAYKAYDQARQKDIVPLRALNEFNDIVRDVAKRNQVILADVEKMFIKVSPNGIPGWNLFADHVHPTLEGQQLVAWVILNALTEAGVAPVPQAEWQQKMPEARKFLQNQLDNVSARYRAMGYWGVGRLFYWAGKYKEAEQVLSVAWASVKDVPEIPYQLGMMALYRGDGIEAIESLSEASRLDPENQQIVIGKAKALSLLKRWDEALAKIDSLTAEMQLNVDVMQTRAVILAGKGERQAAVELLLQAVASAPAVASLRFDLATVLAAMGKMTSAEAAYREGLRLEQHPAPEQAAAIWLKSNARQ